MNLADIFIYMVNGVIFIAAIVFSAYITVSTITLAIDIIHGDKSIKTPSNFFRLAAPLLAYATIIGFAIS